MNIFLELSGLFFGVFTRTWIPYIRKLKQNKIDKFDKKYLKFALGSMILSGISVLLILPQFQESPIKVINFYTGLKVFATAFAFGFSFNTIVNEASKWTPSK